MAVRVAVAVRVGWWWWGGGGLSVERRTHSHPPPMRPLEDLRCSACMCLVSFRAPPSPLKVREVLTRRNEDAAATIQRMQADVDELVAKVEGKRQKNKDKKALLAESRDQSRAKDAELEREMKKKERLDRELKVRVWRGKGGICVCAGVGGVCVWGVWSGAWASLHVALAWCANCLVLVGCAPCVCFAGPKSPAGAASKGL